MSIETLTSAILRQMPEINKWQRDFFHHLLGLFLSLRGRYTYLNLERYGRKNELTYRNHFASGFDFQTFNRLLIEQHTGPQRMIAFDPSFLSKSGKHTPGTGYFWSGCAGKAKWGLEICGFAAVDLSANTALHYFAAQTLPEDGQGLMSFYSALVQKQAPELIKMSRYVCADAFFSKKSFVDAVLESGLHLVTRLRDDAVLHYAPPPKKAAQVGRPKKYGDRFSVKNPDPEQLPCIAQSKEQRIYGGTIYVKSLKRSVKVAIVHQLKADSSLKTAKIYICTDLEFPTQDILTYYKGRFQIEFLYRDGKQHTGLQDTQSRSKEALEYHFNMSLTAVSVAKVAHHLSVDKNQRGPFSMADVKTQYFNELMIDRVFDVFANNPNLTKNHPALQKLYDLGKIAA